MTETLTIGDYPEGTIIAILHPAAGFPAALEHEREWFARLPEHLIPENARGEWQSLADGETWALDPHAEHVLIALPVNRSPKDLTTWL